MKTSTDKVKEAEKDTLQANREALANFKEIAKIIPKGINGIYIKRNILQDVVRIRVYKGSAPFSAIFNSKSYKKWHRVHPRRRHGNGKTRSRHLFF